MGIWHAFYVLMFFVGLGYAAYLAGEFLRFYIRHRRIAREHRPLPEPDRAALRRPETDEDWEAQYGHSRHE